jgi:hypothetical protein
VVKWPHKSQRGSATATYHGGGDDLDYGGMHLSDRPGHTACRDGTNLSTRTDRTVFQSAQTLNVSSDS